MNHEAAGPGTTRREFLTRLAGAALVPGLATGPAAPFVWTHASPRDEYDVLVSGGHVIDPASGLDGPADIGILSGRIARVASRIPPEEARRVIDATGRLVTPGLVDSHVHVYDGVAQVGVSADVVGLPRGVTTLIDGGSAGATTFPGFRDYVVRQSRTRVLALLNIAAPGMTVPNELSDLLWVDPDLVVRTIEEHRDVIVGIKVRMLAGIPGGGDVEVMERTRVAADGADVPIVVHIGGQTSPLSAIMDFLRPGDVVTHALRRQGSILGSDGLVDPAVREAVQRGVFLDVGHGRGNLDFDVAERVLAQGVLPTTISSDVHRGNVAGPVFGLPTTLSKFMAMGMSVPGVIEAATAAPARIFGLDEGRGTLAVGAVADLTVFDMVEGTVEFVDSGGKRRSASRRLVPHAVLLAGREYGSITG